MALNRWTLDRLCAWIGVVSLLTLFVPGALYLLHVATSSVENSLAQNGRTLARTLAGAATEPMLLGDQLSLQNMLEKARIQENVQYICLLDEHGQPAACSHGGGCPAGLIDLLRRQPELFLRFRTAEGPMMNIAAPVLDGQLGQVHVGISRARAVAAGNRLLWMLGVVLTLALSILLGGVRLVASRVGYPLRQLATAISELRALPPQMNLPAAGRGTREVEMLAVGFRDLVQRLTTLTFEQADTQNRMVHTEPSGWRP